MPDTPLFEKMEALADRGHPRGDELRERAKALRAAAKGFANGGGVKPMLGAWARARRVWCECTGEPLI